MEEKQGQPEYDSYYNREQKLLSKLQENVNHDAKEIKQFKEQLAAQRKLKVQLLNILRKAKSNKWI